MCGYMPSEYQVDAKCNTILVDNQGNNPAARLYIKEKLLHGFFYNQPKRLYIKEKLLHGFFYNQPKYCNTNCNTEPEPGVIHNVIPIVIHVLTISTHRRWRYANQYCSSYMLIVFNHCIKSLY